MGVLHTKAGQVGIEQSGHGGIPLLFLHGVGSTRSVWRRQLDHFGRGRLTLAIDYPGYGESKFQPGATRRRLAEVALATLDCLQVERAHVCGLSLGGVVALALHALAPDRLASLTLADSFACHPKGEAIYERARAGVAEHGMAGLAERRAEALLASGHDPAVRAEVIATMKALDPAAYLLASEAVWLADQRREAAQVACPTLILCGSEDRITPPYLSEELRSLIPHSSMIEISGAGHLPNLEQPALFNRILESFLAGAEERS
jgi:3-oxoadipate enol-lactonase